MKRLATLKSVYSLHQQVLGNKAYHQYTDEEVCLHTQSLTISNCIADYARFTVRLTDIALSNIAICQMLIFIKKLLQIRGVGYWICVHNCRYQLNRNKIPQTGDFICRFFVWCYGPHGVCWFVLRLNCVAG